MENRKSPEYLDGERFVTREKALSDLLSRWSFAPETEIVYSAEANGRICAEDVFSLNTLPVFRSAQADGIAVRFVDFAKGVPDSKNWQEGVDYAMADTGDDFDDAFDTVIQVEDLVYDESGGFSIVPEDPPITQGQLIHEQGQL
jgi:molybdopterin molybdotransferase/putative molybdopterin biosynthesis protein